jgi:threonine/homoserine/homoserine lactone efflux protein
VPHLVPFLVIAVFVVVTPGVDTALASLHRSEAPFTVVKLVGAAYLVVLGAQALWYSWRRGQPVARIGPASHRSPFLQGILSNLLNPKVAVFFTGLRLATERR